MTWEKGMAVQLLIADKALLNAVQEQGPIAALQPFTAADAAALAGDNVAAVIVDEAAADKKNLKLLTELAVAGKKKRVFFLGNAPKEWDPQLITESFAKPVRLGHLLARLQFYLQNAPLNTAPVLFGPYRFEAQNRQVVHVETGAVTRLTEKETALLDNLSQTDAAIMREDLLASIWGYGGQIDTHTLETHIYQLRRKLDPQGSGANWLINEQGAYRLDRGSA